MAGKEMKGTVKWFSAKRGYGFLVDADVSVSEGFEVPHPP